MLEIVQPLIIKQVIDGELAGVQTVWIEVENENNYTVNFNDKLYMKEKRIIQL